MGVQIRDDRQALRVSLPADGTLTMGEAVDLVRDLVDAVTQCGFEVKMTVDVPRKQVTAQQIAVAVTRVGFIRRAKAQTPWNDTKANTELVMRVLEACL